jgi:hypothetical protein
VRYVVVVLAAISAAVLAAHAQSFVDVTSDSHYQTLARSYQPTVLHERGEVWFPCAWDCDGDSNPNNNRATYSESCPRTVYVHIMRDTRWNYVFIQYWYYYAYNACPSELVNPVSNRIKPFRWPAAQAIDTLILLFVSHAQDWELAMVTLDGAEKPVSFALGAHNELRPQAWNSISTAPGARTHPFAYAYEGSHAMNQSPSAPAPWWFGVETWSGGGSYTTWEGTRRIFVGSGSGLPSSFGDYPAPWRRSIWNTVPQNLDRASYG